MALTKNLILSSPGLGRAVAAAALLLAGGALTAVASPPTVPVHALDAGRYEVINALSTPLIHHLETGLPYDLNVLLQYTSDMADLPFELISGLKSSNSFERNDRWPRWVTTVEDRIQRLKAAKGYYFQVHVQWGPYDFQGNYFNITPHVENVMRKPGPEYHCSGAHSRIEGKYRIEYKSNCAAIDIRTEKDKFARTLKIDDLTLARTIPERSYNYRLIAVATKAAPYRSTKTQFFRTLIADSFGDYIDGILPLRLIGYVLVTANSEQRPILAVGRTPEIENELRQLIQEWSEKQNIPSGGVKSTPAQTSQQARLPMSEGGANASPGSANPGNLLPPQWTLTEIGQGVKFFSDLRGKKREGNKVKLQEMVSLDTPGPSGERSRVELMEYDCEARTFARLGRILFEKPLGEGKTLTEDRTTLQSSPVTVGTHAEKLWLRACS